MSDMPSPNFALEYSASGHPAVMATIPILFLVAALAVTACTPRSVIRGHIVAESKVEKLEVGVHSQAYVRELLGSPQKVALFDGVRWYYIGRHGKQLAFFEEEVIKQKIVGIHFDSNNIISEIEELDKDDSQTVAMTKRVTPTAGKELGFIEQAIANIGRFRQKAAQP